MSLDAVASCISHEIRQPLSTITMDGEAATIYLERRSPDIQMARSMLQNIIGSAHHISDLLQSVRAIFGKDDHERVPVSINELALEALRVFKTQIGENNIAVKLQLSPELRPVSGHRGQLQEVINNLVQNAIDAMRGDKANRRTLTLRTANESEAVIAEVEDSGSGIEPADVGKIFEPFVSTKPGGMGLGLAICQTIVERHNGSISVAAHPQGSVFRVVLPA